MKKEEEEESSIPPVLTEVVKLLFTVLPCFSGAAQQQKKVEVKVRGTKFAGSVYIVIGSDHNF